MDENKEIGKENLMNEEAALNENSSSIMNDEMDDVVENHPDTMKNVTAETPMDSEIETSKVVTEAPDIVEEEVVEISLEAVEILLTEEVEPQAHVGVAEDFDKELTSARSQKTTHEEEKKEPVAEEIIPDYQTYTPEVLIDELEVLISEQPLENIKGRVSAIKLAFIECEKVARAAAKEALKEASKEEPAEGEEAAEPVVAEFVYPLSERFNAVFDVYKQKKAKFIEDLEKEKETNLNQKNRILDDLRALLVSDQSLKVTYDRFRELQEEWKNIGMVPKQEIASLWNNYHFLIEKFFDKVRIHRELRELDAKKNLELKMALCEKTEELLLEEKINDAFRKLQDYHRQWREIGTVPDENRDEIWERFKLASDTINQRHRDFYESMRGEYENNVHTKEAICDKVEEIAAEPCDGIGMWAKKTEELDELFKLWKSVGPIAKKQNDELWARYSKAIDVFYRNKKEYFGKIKEQQTDNYNLKLNLCVEAEALQDSTDWKNTSREFIRLQDEWKKIGPVPSKAGDKLWKRFRSTCDHFFNNKEAFFSSREAAEPENLKAKEELIEALRNYAFTDLKTENLDHLKEFQRRWMSIGFVPLKEKERLQNEYRTVLNEKMKQLNISSFEISQGDGRYRHFDTQDNRGDGSGLRKEITFLQNKIASMQDEINLWENNIGFLASSKNADILKQEFEKKIQRAKSDLELNIAKLRYLRQELNKDEEAKKGKKEE